MNILHIFHRLFHRLRLFLQPQKRKSGRKMLVGACQGVFEIFIPHSFPQPVEKPVGNRINYSFAGMPATLFVSNSLSLPPGGSEAQRIKAPSGRLAGGETPPLQKRLACRFLRRDRRPDCPPSRTLTYASLREGVLREGKPLPYLWSFPPERMRKER